MKLAELESGKMKAKFLVAAGNIASSSLAQQDQVTLKTGQSTVFAGQVLRYQGLHAERQPQRIVLTATVAVTNALAAFPANRAARMHIGEILRTE